MKINKGPQEQTGPHESLAHVCVLVRRWGGGEDRVQERRVVSQMSK